MNYFEQIFAKAKESPSYWLEFLDLRLSERLFRYKSRYERIKDIEKRKNLGSKIRALRECLSDVRNISAEYESFVDNR